MMNVFHPDFRESVAVDARIHRVSRVLGQEFATFEEEEAFYQGVAAEAGLSAWEVDRLLYWFADETLERYGAEAT